MKCWGQKYAWGSAITTSDGLGKDSINIGDLIPYVDVGSDGDDDDDDGNGNSHNTTNNTNNNTHNNNNNINNGIDQVVCGNRHICVKLNSNNIKCIGSNGYGQIGLGITNTIVGIINGYNGNNLPVINIGNGLNVSNIALGYLHTCILCKIINKIKCFGFNNNGELGYGDKISRGLSILDMGNNLPFIDLGINVEVISLYSGSNVDHNCVILLKPLNITQRIKCWGLNNYFQLGYNDNFNRGDDFNEMGDNLSIIDLGIESRVKQIILGYYHTCSIIINNNLKCWGNGSNGQLASGSIQSIFSFGNLLPYVQIDKGMTIKLIHAGNSHMCIVYNDNLTLKCFGNNNIGQLGQGDTLNRGNTPETMIPNITAIDLGTGILNIISIHCGYSTTCVIFEDSSIKCFGWNFNGQLAIGSNLPKGDESKEMGNNLQYAELFSPTKSPIIPTSLPTYHPTYSPTRQCDYQSAKICKYDYKCIWKKVNRIRQCIIYDCTQLNQSKCIKQSKRCKWNKDSSKCEFNKQQ